MRIKLVLFCIFLSIIFFIGCQTVQKTNDIAKTDKENLREEDSAYLSDQAEFQKYHQENIKDVTPESKTLGVEKYFDDKINKYVDVAAGEILVKYKPFVSAQSIDRLNQKSQVSVVRKLPKSGIYQLSISEHAPSIPVSKLLEAYKNDPAVEYAEPNYIRKLLATIPNDTYYSNQWSLPNIYAPEGWDIERGSSRIAIAVIDSGYDIFQDEIWNKLWRNPVEDAGSNWNNGIDDDNNGYIDDYLGWDFFYIDNAPVDSGNGHGSHVAGIAAAETNENHGIAGVNWHSRIMPLRVANNSGLIYTLDVILAIYYAADNGAQIINLSLGAGSFSAGENTAIQYAHSKGCVIIAATGNDGDSNILYPAAYDNVISVASVDSSDNRSSFSNYNACVDVCAPGGDGLPYDSGDIYSDYLFGDWTYKAGTSMAVPFVSGLAALIFSHNQNLTNVQVENIIFSSVNDLGSPGRDNYYGHGRINVYKALEAANRYHSFSVGISMISIPFYPPTGESSSVTLKVSSSLQLVRWELSSTDPIKYKCYPDSFVGSLSPGKGYFLKLTSGTMVEGLNGYSVPTSSDFEMPLKRGWNQIGAPFAVSMTWNNIKIKKNDGTIITMDEAINKGIIKSGPWKYSNYAYELNETLDPWLGYWVRVSEDANLIIPHP